MRARVGAALPPTDYAAPLPKPTLGSLLFMQTGASTCTIAQPHCGTLDATNIAAHYGMRNEVMH